LDEPLDVDITKHMDALEWWKSNHYNKTGNLRGKIFLTNFSLFSEGLVTKKFVANF